MDNRRIIVPLDVPDAAAALALAARLDNKLCRVKVGKELFVAAGPAVVARLQERGFEVFLDLKFHDIPNTVAGACRAAARSIASPPLACTFIIHTPRRAAARHAPATVLGMS